MYSNNTGDAHSLSFRAQNPYAPPTDNQLASYDHDLFWRILKASLWLFVFFIAVDAFLYWQWGNGASRYKREPLPYFFLDRKIADELVSGAYWSR